MNKRESKMEVYPTYTSKPYQGWRNRETWIVAASIRNDQKLLGRVNKMASGIRSNPLGRHREPRWAMKVERLAGRFEKAFPVVQCGGVDWEAIAEMILENGEV